MSKRIRTIKLSLTIFLFYSGFSLYGQSVMTDTAFIYRDSVLGAKQSIYYDFNKDNVFYKRLSDFSFGRYEKQSYDYSIKCLKDSNIELTKRKINDLPLRWITLKYYKGKYYIYYPCDFLFHSQVCITDSTFIEWTGEGPYANKIVDFQKKNDKTFQFILLGVYNSNQKLVIHIIDSENGIAIFEKKIKNNNNIMYLMVDADKIRNFPIIVNNCEFHKQRELQFEEPDYEKLKK